MSSIKDTSPYLELDHYTHENNAWSLFGYALTTHRLYNDDSSIEFPYQAVMAAISVAFFRTTVYSSNEPWFIRITFGILLAALALARKSYELIIAVETFSYSFVVLVALQPRLLRQSNALLDRLLYGTVGLLLAAAFSYFFAHCLVTGMLLESLRTMTPAFIVDGLFYLIPVQECYNAYEMLQSIALPPTVLSAQVAHLLFVTFHIQTAMGFLGIHFLTKEQERRNMLVRMDVPGEEEEDDDNDVGGSGKGSDNEKTSSVNNNQSASSPTGAQKASTGKMARSRRFQRTAIPFIFRTALPYMLQIIAYGNLNFFCFHCLKHDLHRTVRWHQTLAQDSHWMAMTQTPVSPEGKCGNFLRDLLFMHFAMS